MSIVVVTAHKMRIVLFILALVWFKTNQISSVSSATDQSSAEYDHCFDGDIKISSDGKCAELTK